MPVYQDILGTVGNTPVVRINRIASEGVNLFGKVEAFNPLGSVKDRLALGIIEDAEKRGTLKPGQTVVEATSGNTGIGLAMVCAAKGYPLVVTMAENFSVERRKLMRFLGAKVVLTPASEKGSGMLKKAEELAEKHGWFLCRQFENEANADMHSRTTAQEILADFPDGSLDYFVTGYGTGGTLKGISRVLREKSPNTRIIVCEPDNSAVLASKVPQPRSGDGKISGSHPVFRPHLMQGWSPDFIPKLVEDSVSAHWFDEILSVNGNDALRLSRELATKEGIFVGISAGATLAAALEVAKRAKPGANILCMLPDTGERYLTTPLFEGVSEAMTDEEWALSRSTPSIRFDASSAAPAPAAVSEALDPEAVKFVENITREEPVVMFAHEWCEFCWAVRKLFKHYGIEYRSVDMDSAEYLDGQRGARIRGALRDRTGINTVPQVFVADEFVGGCTETFDEFISGKLQERLRKAEFPFDGNAKADPYSFLPKWLHPR